MLAYQRSCCGSVSPLDWIVTSLGFPVALSPQWKGTELKIDPIPKKSSKD
jgi:hypothetical protein